MIRIEMIRIEIIRKDIVRMKQKQFEHNKNYQNRIKMIRIEFK